MSIILVVPVEPGMGVVHMHLFLADRKCVPVLSRERIAQAKACLLANEIENGEQFIEALQVAEGSLVIRRIDCYARREESLRVPLCRFLRDDGSYPDLDRFRFGDSHGEKTILSELIKFAESLEDVRLMRGAWSKTARKSILSPVQAQSISRIFAEMFFVLVEASECCSLLQSA